MTPLFPQIADNIHRVSDAVAAACARAQRDPASVLLVAVTKYAQWEWVQAIVGEGVVDLGESRPQQLIERASLLPQSIHWHLIGHLQRNKVRQVLPDVALIHSVDTLKLLERIDAIAAELSLKPRVLLEINLAGEAAKDGFRAEDLMATWERICECPHVQVDGLMAMAPHTGSQDDARRVFCNLRELRDQLLKSSPPDMTLSELSMGMSGDFEVAIEEGASIIRVGSLLFDGVGEAGP